MRKFMFLGIATVLLAVPPQLASAAPASSHLGITTDIQLVGYGGGGYGGGGYYRPRYYRPRYYGGYGGRGYY